MYHHEIRQGLENIKREINARTKPIQIGQAERLHEKYGPSLDVVGVRWGNDFIAVPRERLDNWLAYTGFDMARSWGVGEMTIFTDADQAALEAMWIIDPE